MKKNLWQRFLFRFPRIAKYKDQGGVIVLVSAVLSLTLWFLVTLNQEYNDPLRYPVKINGIPETIELTGESSFYVDIIARGGGVNLMMEHIKLTRDTIELAFNPEYLKVGYIPTSQYRDEIVRTFPFEILGITPERIYFSFETKVYKRVPLKLQADFQLLPPYQLIEKPQLLEDSVTILGPPAKLDSIEVWHTANVRTKVVPEEERVMVPVIDSIPELTVYPKFVSVKVTPHKYTQTELRIPIDVTDVPRGSEVRLGHRHVNFSCLVPLDDYESILKESENYRISVSFYSLSPSSSHIIPQPRLPETVKLVSRSPFKVPYVIISK